MPQRFSSVQFLNSPGQYAPRSAMAVAADGFTITYANGHTALCGTSGVWNASLGYGNQAVAEAIHAAARQASFLGQFRAANRYAEDAAALLLTVPRWPYSRVLFSTSGSAAVDAAMKLCRLAGHLAGEPRRLLMVSVAGSYHGMTIAGMGVAGQDLGQRALGLSRSETRLIPRDDPDAVKALLRTAGSRVAGVIVEPVLGSGTLPVSRDVLDAILAGREEHGYLVVADEVATGFGRTGPWFASDQWPAQPDILVTSKALSNGTMPVSALLHSPRLADRLDAADAPTLHAETQAGSPIPCAAVMATIAEYRRLDALEQGGRTSRILSSWLEETAAELPGASHQGVGCFRTLRLRDGDGADFPPARVAALVERCRAAGATVYPGPSGVQLVPALTYEPRLLERHLAIVRDTLHAEYRGRDNSVLPQISTSAASQLVAAAA